jgi:2-methylcitrate dehydratase PrpD
MCRDRGRAARYDVLDGQVSTSIERKGPTRVLAEFAASLRYEDVPAHVISMAKKHTLNIAACALRGHSLESAQIVLRVHRMMGGTPESVVIGDRIKLPAPMAAGVNAHSAYCTMNDDTFFEGTVHPGHTAVPASLAVAEREGASGKDYLTAVVTGLEVGCRVAASLCQSQESHKARLGWHCNISDAFIGVGSAGRLLGLTVDQFVAGLGIAATSSSGLVETMNPPPSYVWPWDGGMNTYLGVLGAYLARAGMTAGHTALEGEQGYIRMFTNGKAPREAYDRVIRGLGEEWHTAEIAIKTRCASFMMHTAINATQRAVRNNHVEPENIESITIKTNHWTSGRLMVQEVNDYNSTVFSLPFAIAVAILDGGGLTLPDRHLAYLNDRRARELMGRIRAETDPVIDRVFGARMPTAVIVRTKDGREYRESEDTPKGKYPEKPLSEDEFLRKIRGNASHSLTDDQINRLVTLVEGLEDLGNVAPLAALLAPGA